MVNIKTFFEKSKKSISLPGASMVVDCSDVLRVAEIANKGLNQANRRAAMQYYGWIVGKSVEVEDLDLIPLHFHQKWMKQKTSGAIRIRAFSRNPDGSVEAIMVDAACRLRGGFFEDGELDPFCKATLLLQGENKITKKPIFAILVLNQDLYRQPIMWAKFSPVPFGIDCKPKLPYTDAGQQKLSLKIAKVALTCPSSTIWTKDSFAKGVREATGIPYYEFDDSHAWFWLGEFEKLVAVKCVKENSSWAPAMTYVQFEEIFGVKLPDIIE